MTGLIVAFWFIKGGVALRYLVSFFFGACGVMLIGW